MLAASAADSLPPSDRFSSVSSVDGARPDSKEMDKQFEKINRKVGTRVFFPNIIQH